MSDARKDLVEAVAKLRISMMQMGSTRKAIDSHLSRTGSRISAMVDSADAVANAASGDADNILRAAQGVREAAAIARGAVVNATTRAKLAAAYVEDAKDAASAAKAEVVALETGQVRAPLSTIEEVSVRLTVP